MFFISDEGERVICFVYTPQFSEATVGYEACGGAGEGDMAEGAPKIFADGGGNGFLAEEGKLF